MTAREHERRVFAQRSRFFLVFLESWISFAFSSIPILDLSLEFLIVFVHMKCMTNGVTFAKCYRDKLFDYAKVCYVNCL